MATTITTLSNGLTVIVEEIPEVESAAYELLIPGGILTDPEERVGECLVLAELTARGAAGLSSRALSDAFDDAGIRHGESAGHDRFGYRGSLIADKLPLALRYVAAMVRAPTLPAEEIDSIRSLLLQDIAALEDNPARKAGVELSQRYYPAPHNRPGMGSIPGLQAVNGESVRAQWQRVFKPSGSVLSVAGKVTTAEVMTLVEQHFGDWKGQALEPPKLKGIPPFQHYHLHSDSAQLQIVLAYPGPKFGDPLYYAAKVMNGIFSGGMFGRLFIEVREKRGLCYSVYSRHSATKEFGTVTAYAGTTPERAHETFEVMVRELRRVKGTVEAQELARSKANLKANLILGEESSSSRASSNAGDWVLDKKVRSLDDIQRAIDAVTVADLDLLAEQYPAEQFALLTLGARDIRGQIK